MDPDHAFPVFFLNRQFGTETAQHAFGMVARGIGSITLVMPGVLSACQQHRALDLGARDGRR